MVTKTFIVRKINISEQGISRKSVQHLLNHFRGELKKTLFIKNVGTIRCRLPFWMPTFNNQTIQKETLGITWNVPPWYIKLVTGSARLRKVSFLTIEIELTFYCQVYHLKCKMQKLFTNSPIASVCNVSYGVVKSHWLISYN